MSRPKEVSFFQDNMDFQPNPNYEKGWEWYQQAFAHYNGEPLIGEATPSYSDRSRSPQTSKRIYKFNPEAKIIYMVRDPLARQISCWKMQYAMGIENSFPWRREHQWAVKGFNYWMLMQRDVQQWDECRYGYQLASYEDCFPVNNIFVSFLEDWQRSKATEVSRIMSFLGLDPNLWQQDIPEEANRGSDRTIERPLVKKLRTHPIVETFVKKFPITWRDWARSVLARTRIKPPAIQLAESTKEEFLHYVSEDSYPFLQRYGKDPALWSGIKA